MLTAVGGDLRRAINDANVRNFLYRRLKQMPVGDVPEQYSDLIDAATLMGNCFELIGGMIRSKVASANTYVDGDETGP